MPYDRDLAARTRAALAGLTGLPGLTERPMFGGLSFLIDGNLALAVRAGGGLLVRVDAADAEHLQRTTDTEPARMGSRVMKGWLHVPADALQTDADLDSWLRRAVDYARSLPPKAPTRGGRRT